MAATTKAPVEKKVKWATYLALLAGLGVALLNQVVADAALMGSLPPWAQFVISLAVPPLLAFLGGYQAEHTPREIR